MEIEYAVLCLQGIDYKLTKRQNEAVQIIKEFVFTHLNKDKTMLKIRKNISVQSGCEWNILDAGGCRIAVCGTDNNHETDGPTIAKEIVDNFNKVEVLQIQINNLVSAITGLLGVNEISELEEMEAIIRVQKERNLVPQKDAVVAINAITAVLDTIRSNAAGKNG